MLDEIITQIYMRVLNAICVLWLFHGACRVLYAPPRDKDEKKQYHIFKATTPFEKFCTTRSPRIIDMKDYMTITLEGYYPSCILGVAVVIELAINFGAPLVFAYYFTTFMAFVIALTGAILKKPILKLSKKYIAKKYHL